MDNHRLLKIVLERAIDQLTLNKLIHKENPNSELSKWRCLVERIFKTVVSEISKERKETLLLHHIKETELQEISEKSELASQENLRSHIEFHEESLETEKKNLRVAGRNVNQSISELKDTIETETEYASQKFKKCENHEDALAQGFHKKLYHEREEWKTKITSLEMQMQNESHRNAEKRTELCLTIEQLAHALQCLRENWKESSHRFSKEKTELLSKRDSLRPKIDSLSNKLEKRKLVVNQNQQARKLAEEEYLALIRISQAVVRVQSWWRGVLARKAYARFKIASVKKNTRTKNRGKRMANK